MAVSDTNYAELHNLTALASQGYGLSKDGMYTQDIYNQLKELETNFNAILTKLDADGGVTLTTYNATYAIDLRDKCSDRGIDQNDIVSLLDDFITKFNLCLTALDGDAGVADADYNSTLAITDNINSSTYSNRNDGIFDHGMNQGELYDILSTIVTNVNALNAKLDADA